MNQEKEFRVSPESKLPFQSFQATFYSVDELPGYIGKVYGHERIWGMIPLDSPVERDVIIAEEIKLLQVLAPQLNPHSAFLDFQNGTREVAIVMKRVNPSGFLEERLSRGEQVPLDLYQELARKIADFHFRPEVCPPAEVSSMATFLLNLMREEMLILRERFSEESSVYEDWGNLIRAYIENNAQALNRRQLLIGEPIYGHGDIKIPNIVFVPDVGIIDPAPIKIWKVNDRRMDAYFLRADLELSGFAEEASAYWGEYNVAYDSRIASMGLSIDEQTEIKDSNRIIDLISHVYRLTIFYRLAKSAGDVQRASKAEELLSDAYEKISKILSTEELN